jgi:hypothetical protein
VPDVYENERWNKKLSVVQNDSHCSWIRPYSLCYGLTVWLWKWRLKYLQGAGKSMPSRLSAHSSRLEILSARWRVQEPRHARQRHSWSQQEPRHARQRHSWNQQEPRHARQRCRWSQQKPRHARQRYSWWASGRSAARIPRGKRARSSEPEGSAAVDNFLHVTLV